MNIILGLKTEPKFDSSAIKTRSRTSYALKHHDYKNDLNNPLTIADFVMRIIDSNFLYDNHFVSVAFCVFEKFYFYKNFNQSLEIELFALNLFEVLLSKIQTMQIENPTFTSYFLLYILYFFKF